MSNFWFGYQVTDPMEMETRFSNLQNLTYLDNSFDSATSEEYAEKLEKLELIIKFLPPKEADFVELYYFKNKKQTDIAEIFQVSQPTVCYRLQRATERIIFLLELPKITKEELTDKMTEVLSDPIDVEIMLLMNETSCQSAVAKKLNVSQGLVRHRFKRAIKKMKKMEDCTKFVDLFEMIDKNLNKKREVKRSSEDEELFYYLI